jgi:hypothetical protein
MKWILAGLIAVLFSGGCSVVEETVRRNDDRYARPGAMDSPLTGIYKTFQFNLLDKYRVTHQWLESGCSYRGVEQKDATPGKRSYFYIGRDIFEENGKTWLRFEGRTPFDFDRYVRSVKQQVPIYAPATQEEVKASEKAMRERIERSRKTGRMESAPPDSTGRKPIRYEEKEFGFQAVCGESWWVTSHLLNARLYKRDLATWRSMLTESNPKGRWSEHRVGANVWLAQETAEQDFGPRPLNGVGGPFQTWLLPIGDTGYTIALHLGASRESLQYPDAHTRFQAAFRHLIESVKIEPIRQ